jgi:hypothetical protein
MLPDVDGLFRLRRPLRDSTVRRARRGHGYGRRWRGTPRRNIGFRRFRPVRNRRRRLCDRRLGRSLRGRQSLGGRQGDGGRLRRDHDGFGHRDAMDGHRSAHDCPSNDEHGGSDREHPRKRATATWRPSRGSCFDPTGSRDRRCRPLHARRGDPRRRTARRRGSSIRGVGRRTRVQRVRWRAQPLAAGPSVGSAVRAQCLAQPGELLQLTAPAVAGWHSSWAFARHLAGNCGRLARHSHVSHSFHSHHVCDGSGLGAGRVPARI